MDTAKPPCQYGDKCYRKNSAHLAEFSHPPRSASTESLRSRSPIDCPPPPPPPPKNKTKLKIKLKSPGTLGEKHSKTGHASSPSSSSSTVKKGAKGEKVASVDPKSPASGRGASSSASTASLSSASSPQHPQKCFDSNTDAAMLEEYQTLLADHAEFIRQKFMVNMPDDFYKFYDFCATQNGLEPYEALQNFGLLLTGPYDVLAGKFDKLPPMEPAKYLRHRRFFYDPPEFQTVLVSQPDAKRRGLHFGYWRDDPSLPAENNCMVASNDEDVGCHVTIVADNIFVAVLNYLEKENSKSPFVRAAAMHFSKLLRAFAHQHKIPLDAFAERNRQRNLTVVCKTFHRAGLVVPVEPKNKVGYRPLLEKDDDLKKILHRIDKPEEGGSEAVLALVMEKLQPLITAANIAVDECDFGNSIELGLDLFCSGATRLHAIAMQLLATGYSMVHRPQLIAIVKAHLSQRKCGPQNSIAGD